MKKFIALVLSLVMALSLCAPAWGAEGDVATFDDLKDAVESKATAINVTTAIPITEDISLSNVTITTSVVEPFNVTAGTLTLGAGVVINANDAIFEVSGTGKVVIDGAVLNVTNGENCAVCAKSSGTIELKSGSINQSGVDKVTVSIKGAGASLVMSGGEITSGGSSALIAYEGGTATISGGTVTSANSFAAYACGGGSITVSGGTVTNNVDDKPALVASKTYGTTGGSVTVKSGTVKGVKAHEDSTSAAVIEGGNITGPVSTDNGATASITGGTFSTDVSDYVAVGYIQEQEGDTYTVTKYTPPAVVEPETETEIKVVAPDVDADIDTGKMNDAEKEVVTTLNAADSVQFEADTALNAAVAEEVDVTVTAEDITELSAVLERTVTGDEVAVVVQTSFKVEVEAVSMEGDEASIELNITPVYQKFVTTQDVVNSNVALTDENSVVFDVEELVKVEKPVTISVAIPDALVALADGTLYVTHDSMHVYEATVTGNVATFIAKNGFSPFVISLSSPAVASVNGNSYVKLQDAVDAANNGDTIELLADSDEDIDLGNKTVTIVANGHKLTGDIDADGVEVDRYTNGNVVSVPNKHVSAGGAVLATDFNLRGEAQFKAWTPKVELKKAEDTKDSEFATYTIEMIAKVDNAPIWWQPSGVEEKGEDVDFAWYGEKEFVKVADEAYADVVLVDGKTVTYFAAASTINADGWDGVATKVVLPALPVDEADKVCNTMYSPDEAYPVTLYFYDDALWVGATADNAKTAADETVWTDVLNVDGVAVFVRKAVEGTDYEWNTHTYQALIKEDHDNKDVVTKLYCQDCKAEFKFVQAPETVAIAVFGAGNYEPIKVQGIDLFMELVLPTNWPSAAASVPSVDSDKTVQSPDTFDAGIALYVGMSVMAAAGSAVVLKKKD